MGLQNTYGKASTEERENDIQAAERLTNAIAVLANLNGSRKAKAQVALEDALVSVAERVKSREARA